MKKGHQCINCDQDRLSPDGEIAFSNPPFAVRVLISSMKVRDGVCFLQFVKNISSFFSMYVLPLYSSLICLGTPEILSQSM